MGKGTKMLELVLERGPNSRVPEFSLGELGAMSPIVVRINGNTRYCIHAQMDGVCLVLTLIPPDEYERIMEYDKKK